MAIFLSFLSLISCAAKAGTIQGIALENLTGLPLARTRVTLARLEGNALRPVAKAIASRDGRFSFSGLDEGYYQLTGVRAGFAEAGSHVPGSPIFLARDKVEPVELRLKRLGIVTGRTLDENRVGLPGVPVVAYSVEVPRRILGSATSDDLGVYRITGLPPGKCLIRSGAAQLEDALDLLPTYYPFASNLATDARPVVVQLDGETPDIDIAPVEGNLLALSVKVAGCLGVAHVTLSSGTGRRTALAACNADPVSFNGLARDDYQILAEGEGSQQKLAGFAFVQVLGNSRTIDLKLGPLVDVDVRVGDRGGSAIREAGVVARRYDFAGEGPLVSIPSDHVQLLPGFWQVAARPTGGVYLTDIKINSAGLRRMRREPDPDWYEFFLEYPVQVNVALSANVARLSGRVTLGDKGAIAAPVYLLATTPQTRQRMNGLRITYTGTDGQYRFEGLAPGAYQVLCTFDSTEVNEDALVGRGQTVTLEEGRGGTQDLVVRQLP